MVLILIGFEAIGFGETWDDDNGLVGGGDSLAIDQVFVFVRTRQKLLFDLVS